MNITLPSQVKYIIDTLEEKGYEAYAVGGCVRDTLLFRTPDDWDITTSAKPAEVKSVFKRTIDTGIEHGTVTVLADGGAYEVTTYRIDGQYLDGRHPSEVEFTSLLSEDLRRRDFTINAMAYSDREGLIDLFDGMGDMKRKQIRCVGDAKERFSEDALRILRAVRFAAQLGFQIEASTREAAGNLSGTLQKISAERIQVEVVKLLVSPHPSMWGLVWEMGIASVILPEYSQIADKEHLMKALEISSREKAIRLAIVLHPLGEKAAGKILKRLKFDNDTFGKVTRLVKYVNFMPELTEPAIRRGIFQVGEDLFDLLLQVQEALFQAAGNEEGLNHLQKEKELRKVIQERGDCISLTNLAVNGKDLLSAGMIPGPQVGETLKFLLDEVLGEPARNEKKILLAILEDRNKRKK